MYRGVIYAKAVRVANTRHTPDGGNEGSVDDLVTIWSGRIGLASVVV